MTMLLLFAMLLAQTAPVAAPAVNCATVRVAIPASLVGWSETASAPTIGKAFVVAGADPTTVRGLRVGEVTKPGNAALVPFEVDDDATYRVALSEKAWADVVSGPRVIKSIAHTHGPACSGITKVVDFPLKRGRYTLHITGLSAASVRVLIAKA
ncbi:hypothetical protein EAH87_00360 [Sphingomonas koreensis]|nr:hypothetical protein EAH87_00360 [Sphingomonas koreensis]